MNRTEEIRAGRTWIGIELGSTRIKAVLIGSDSQPLASGAHTWENQLLDGVWTYSLDAVKAGLQACFAALLDDAEKQYGVIPQTAAGIGISAMMHGYLVFGGEGDLLVPFRTWRNTMTAEAAERLSQTFGFNIPQRWSIAHLYQAILRKEPHVPEIRFLTTLAGYVHYLLTGERVIGIGDASGIFPINPQTKQYDAEMCAQFDALTAETAFTQKLTEILPKIVPVGECAGRLTEAGARLLDPSGRFQAGVPFCPPEGDAQTGMTATNSVTPKTGNVSAGTSIFAMIVLERSLKEMHREIDIVTTPAGDPVAMVHCNNCSSDLDAWVKLLHGFMQQGGTDLQKGAMYDMFYALAAKGEPDCSGIIAYNYFAGEEITGLTRGMPMLLRSPDSRFTPENLARSLVYSCMATLKLGMDILTGSEGVQLAQIYAHGGLFKTPVASQPFLAAALGTDVTLMQSAGEGGAWGIALLAAYMSRENRDETLSQYLSGHVFAGMQGVTVSPEQKDIDGMQKYMQAYRKGLAAERAAAAD